MLHPDARRTCPTPRCHYLFLFVPHVRAPIGVFSAGYDATTERPTARDARISTGGVVGGAGSARQKQQRPSQTASTGRDGGSSNVSPLPVKTPPTGVSPTRGAPPTGRANAPGRSQVSVENRSPGSAQRSPVSTHGPVPVCTERSPLCSERSPDGGVGGAVSRGENGKALRRHASAGEEGELGRCDGNLWCSIHIGGGIRRQNVDRSKHD